MTKLHQNVYLLDLKLKKSKFAEKVVFEFQRANFYNQRKELVATTDLWLIRAERRKAREKGKYSISISFHILGLRKNLNK